jgi:hypothetical protein
MTLCPIAIAVGCRKCPIFRVCPAKSILGDYKPDTQARTSVRRGAERRPAKKK